MPKKILALGGCLLLTGAAFANKTYTVRDGDTISGIARKFGVSQKDLLKTNKLASPNKLKLGLQLTIPSVTVARAESQPKKAKFTNSYSVKPGENDWIIAKRLHTTADKLHQLNPGVQWSKLQIGTELRIPGGSSPSIISPKTSTATVSKKFSGSGYKVVAGDNDGKIAKKLGITTAKLHKLNPGVKWTRLQIGESLKTASTAVVASKAPVKTAAKAKSGQITADDVAVRRGPSSRQAKVVTVAAGTKVSILNGKNGWYQVRFPKGTVGWVKDDFVTRGGGAVVASKAPAKKAAKAMKLPKGVISEGKLVAFAKTFLGTRYRWAQASRGGTDCSGFSTQVMRHFGISLPRRSSEQAQRGRYVAKSEIKAGDLVFFRTGRSRRINHVGVAISNTQFIHASSGQGRVVTNSLVSGHYTTCFATARRVANVKNVHELVKALPKAEKKEQVAEVAAPGVEQIPATSSVE